jgi:hypothetical protein
MTGSILPPTRTEIRQKLDALIDGTASREDVANWASQWVILPNSNVHDEAVWRALTRLSGADLKTTDRPYLHDDEDFASWLSDFDLEAR